MWAECKKSNPPNELYETTAEMVVTALCRSMTGLSCRVAENPMHKHVAELDRGIGIKRSPPPNKKLKRRNIDHIWRRVRVDAVIFYLLNDKDIFMPI
jgi:hypothetical protein